MAPPDVEERIGLMGAVYFQGEVFPDELPWRTASHRERRWTDLDIFRPAPPRTRRQCDRPQRPERRDGGTRRRALAPRLRNEAVSRRGWGDEVLGVGRVFLELPAKLSEIDPQVVGLGLVARSPYFLEQLPLADQPAGVTDQDLQQVPLGRRQPNRCPVGVLDLLCRRGRSRTRGSMTGKISDVGFRRSEARIRARSSSIPKGFVHVVRRRRQAPSASFARVAREHEDRNFGTTGATPAMTLLPSMSGRPRVENNQVPGCSFFQGSSEGMLTVGREADVDVRALRLMASARRRPAHPPPRAHGPSAR